MFHYKAALLMTLGAFTLAACGGERDMRDPQTPSGFKVPRYVSIRSNEVNGRAGPSEEHPILWTYTAPGLPLQVVAETEDWRRVCDPEGGLSWVKRTFVTGERKVMRVKADHLAVMRRPEAGAQVVAWLNPKAVANLDKCDKGWCRIEIAGTRGWAQESEIWGTAETSQCRGATGQTRTSRNAASTGPG